VEIKPEPKEETKPEPPKEEPKPEAPSKWKKSNEITGISVGSIINFKATVAQEKEAILSGRTTKIRRLETQADISTIVRNKGVALRAQRDKEQQATQGEKTLQDVESRLKEKQLIYDQFIAGNTLLNPEELSKSRDFLVDFEQKSWDQDNERKEFYHPDMEREEERMRWEAMARATLEEEEKDAQIRHEKRILLNQIIEETKEGRDKVSSLQEQRQKKVELRKQQIKKQAELQKKRKLEQTTTPEQTEPAEATPVENKKKLQLKKPANRTW